MTIQDTPLPHRALLAVALLLTQPADALAESLRVGVYHNPPKLMPDEQGQPSGILGDLLLAMAAQEGWQLEAVPCTWQACLTALEAGELDLLPDVAWTEERNEIFAFHDEPVMHSWSQVYQRPGLSLDAIVDLDGHRVAVLEGSIQRQFLDQLTDSFGVTPLPVEVSSFEEGFAAVRDGRAEASVVNRHYGDWQANAQGLEVTPIMFQPARLFFAAPAGAGQEVLARIDHYMGLWKPDARSPYHRALARWSVESDDRFHIPPLLWWGLGGLLFMLSLAAGLSLLLRHRILARTAQYQEVQARNYRLAHFSPVTGLPNRGRLIAQLEQAISAQHRHEWQERHGALMLLDLDRFKLVNDLYSHEAGDRLLQQVAEALERALDEPGFLAHLGGDEFAIMIDEIDLPVTAAAHRVEHLAETLLAAVSSLAPCQDAPQTTASIGATLFTAGKPDAGSVIQQVDMALARAKTAGGNTLRFFSEEIHREVMARVRMEQDLARALARDELLLHYQPQVSADGRCIGVEALLRWQHPQRGMISPVEFIPLAEQTRLILPIGHWVLRCACRLLASWADSSRADLRVAVNVSAVQFHQPDFIDLIKDVLRETGAPAERLTLEVTESLLMEDPERVRVTLGELRDLGIRLALDDFGTGYSSLNYLKRLPLDELKVDRSFVMGVPADASDAAIVETTLTLAASLGLDVVAEGVEHAEQLDWLASRGCRAFQGYHFRRPAPLEELTFDEA
ncbi:EAL domain-containing protein [Halomonas sp. PGE1]|uniref:putative bifunctional diguanylate cyclase/phosphodiesterase n=1 Tax=Halomonas sp. PGE1 TaxID=2730360 RepID=UPI00201632BE|nr:EAL domain-containing protein [Halomonas sp. PGE1]